MSSLRISTLREVLRQAAARTLEDGWLYLKERDGITPDASCLMVSDSDDSGAEALRAGFPYEGLDNSLLEDTAYCARRFDPDPTDALLLESFLYYWRFDAWLPHPGAPEPLPPDEAQRITDQEFFDRLTPRSHFMACRIAGCERGAIEHSALCNVHHFESIWKRPCPFAPAELNVAQPGPSVEG
ncbi:DUF7716 domain-containing protein [Roseateles chitinivorans]|uniref:DUF7716 domain-containing protein n=1 Tax=Roseateles chitinivorans TaxID=2917965 RepID=UPI003D66E746